MSEKILLIVGAGPGISLNTARKFGKEGFNVALDFPQYGVITEI